jgi:hypothetical protein
MGGGATTGTVKAAAGAFGVTRMSLVSGMLTWTEARVNT